MPERSKQQHSQHVFLPLTALTALKRARTSSSWIRTCWDRCAISPAMTSASSQMTQSLINQVLHEKTLLCSFDDIRQCTKHYVRHVNVLIVVRKAILPALTQAVLRNKAWWQEVWK